MWVDRRRGPDRDRGAPTPMASCGACACPAAADLLIEARSAWVQRNDGKNDPSRPGSQRQDRVRHRRRLGYRPRDRPHPSPTSAPTSPCSTGLPARPPQPPERIEGIGRRALAIEGDTGDEQTVVDAFAETRRVLGEIDAAIACAGVLGEGGPVFETPVEDFEHVMGVNVRGSFPRRARGRAPHAPAPGRRDRAALQPRLGCRPSTACSPTARLRARC